MFSLLRSRIFVVVLAWFGLSNWADTKIDPNWHWHHITTVPFKEWVRQVPVQLPVRIAQGLQYPVDYAVAELSKDTMPWYVKTPAKTFGAAVLYALVMRFAFWRLRSRFGGLVGAAPPARG
jgi:hypothetical protein